MRKTKILFATILLAVAAGWLAAQDTQEPQSPAGAPGSTAVATKPIKVRVELVNVLFTVTDKKNRLVLDLTKDDVRVLEDKQPQSIRFFSRESDLPLRIGILIDTSNSIRERLRFEQEAAIDFLNATVRPGKDQAYVVAFDVEPQLFQDYTDDMEKLSKAIRGLRAGGGTGLYDAIYFSAKEKMLFFPPPEPYLRRVMIIVSDGLDNQSEHTREEALAMAQRGEVTVFAISTNRTGLAQRGDKVLKYLAEETGGRAFFPFSAGDLAGDFQEISRELRSQYSLAYVSSNIAHDGTFRAITIQSKGKGVHVRAKSGYFAPSQ
ncbi:MAG: VWA domain-containing protein [Acidobacteriia bacterium]|nr:VWA domain-containing protein [Terriglobia bacterium]